MGTPASVWGREEVSSALSIPNSTHNLLLSAYIHTLEELTWVSGKKSPVRQARFIREVSPKLSQEVSFEGWNRKDDKLRKEQSSFIELFKGMSGKN